MAIGASDIDSDVQAAVISLWQATPALAGLFAQPPQAGRLKSTQAAPQKLPYAQVESVFARSDRAVGYTLDRRKVTLTLRGVRDQVTTALLTVGLTFNAQLGNPSVIPLVTLKMPSGARFVSWLPTNNDGSVKQEETNEQGQEIWAGVIEATLTTVRQ